MPNELLGPAGALIGAITIIVALWRDHQRADADDRMQRDKAMDLLKQMANAWDARNAAEAVRRRESD